MTESLALVVGADDIPPKEQLVLKSLLRLLDGRIGLRLSFSEALRDCNVVFAQCGLKHNPTRPTVLVRVLPQEGDADGGADSLSIQAPLRMSNVMETLRACVDAIKSTKAPEPTAGASSALIDLLTRGLACGSRSKEAYAIEGEGRLLLDFGNDRIHSSAPLEALASGNFRLALLPQAMPDAEVAALPVHRLRELLWSAAHRVGQDDRPTEALSGHYRLLRWPDAAALRHPGFPRLAALLTNRPFDVAAASQASGVSPAGVQAFLRVCLSLGIAVAADAPAPAAEPASTPMPGTLRSVIGRLRERLKLW